MAGKAYQIKDVVRGLVVVTYQAESFEIMGGTALLIFKNRSGQQVAVHHLAPGHTVSLA